MKLAILGTGDVGLNLASKLVELGNQVMVGSRNAEKAQGLAKKLGRGASGGTFLLAAEFGEVIFNCTNGASSLDALRSTGDRLDGKVLIDVANPLNFSNNQASLTVSNTDSLGEQIQRAHPKVKVVKALNTMNNQIMTNPGILPEETDVFICGNDAAAKTKVTEILGWFGWKNVIDLGGIESARGMEAVLLLWLSLAQKFGFKPFNYKIVRQSV